jgi:hypothetical protein
MQHEHLHTQNHETNDNIEFMKPYQVVAADSEVEKAVNSDVLLHLSKTNTSCVITGRCIVVLFGISLSGHALLNTSRTRGNDLNTK